MLFNSLITIFIIIILISIFFNSKKSINENFTDDNIIQNGNFEYGKMTKNHFGSFVGNSIVKMANPGESTYVLRQTSTGKKNIDTNYQINLDILPLTHYKLGCWVAYTDNWDGNRDIFNLKFYLNSGDNKIMVGEGESIKSVMVGNLYWNYQLYKFTSPIDSNNKLEINLGFKPKNSIGYRYITDIELKKIILYYQNYQLMMV